MTKRIMRARLYVTGRIHETTSMQHTLATTQASYTFTDNFISALNAHKFIAHGITAFLIFQNALFSSTEPSHASHHLVASFIHFYTRSTHISQKAMRRISHSVNIQFVISNFHAIRRDNFLFLNL